MEGGKKGKTLSTQQKKRRHGAAVSETVRGGREDDCQHLASQSCLDEHNSLCPPSIYPKHTQEYTQWDLKTPGDIQMCHEHMYTHMYCTCQGKQLLSTGHLSQVDVILGACWYFTAVVLMNSWLTTNMKKICCHVLITWSVDMTATCFNNMCEVGHLCCSQFILIQHSYDIL